MRKLFLSFILLICSLFSAQASSWYLIGSFNNWKECDPDYKFTNTGGSSYTYEVHVPILTGEFVIVKGNSSDTAADWSTKIGAYSYSNSISANSEFYYYANNYASNIVFDGTLINATVTLNTLHEFIMLKGSSGTSVTTWEVYGNIGTDPYIWSGTAMTQYSTNIYKTQINVQNDDAYFLVRKCNNGIAQAYYGNPYVSITGDETITLDQYSSGDISIAKGTYDLELNTSTNTLKVTKVNQVIPQGQLTIDPSSLSLEKGSTAQLSLKYNSSGVNSSWASWSSSNTSVATVSNGVVTAIAVGDATITASWNGAKATCSVTVSNPASTGSSNKVYYDNSYTKWTQPRAYFWNGDYEPVVWPGTDMTYVSGSIWSITIPSGTNMVVFNGDGNTTIRQTTDFNVTMDHRYYTDTNKGGSDMGLYSDNSEPYLYISPLQLTIEKRNTAQLWLTYNSAPLFANSATWSSSNTAVASVSNGLVTANKVGTATITATYNGSSTSCSITVVDKTTYKRVYYDNTLSGWTTPYIMMIENNTDIEAYPGSQMTRLSGNIWYYDVPEYASSISFNNGVSYRIESRYIAYTANHLYMCYGQDTCDDLGTYTSTTRSFSLSPATMTINGITTSTITAKYGTFTIPAEYIIWSSSNISVATVSNAGKVTSKNAGTTTIRGEIEINSNCYATCGVTVASDISSIKLNISDGTMAANSAVNLTAKSGYTDITSRVTWSSSNTAVATVDSNGKLTAVGNGTATISAKYMNITTKVKVTVFTPTAFNVGRSFFRMYLGQGNLTLVPIILPQTPSILDFSWKSSNTAVATVNAEGTVSPKTTGKTTITATSGSLILSADIEVVNAGTPGVVLDRIAKTQLTLPVNETEQLVASFTTEPSSTKVTWASSDTKIATVSSSGLVTAVGTGKANITASFNGITEICELTVPLYDFSQTYKNSEIFYRILSSSSRTLAVTAASTDYNSYSGIVELPQKVSYAGKEYTITEIDKNAFKNCKDLVSLIMSDRITSIGEGALTGLTGLKQLKFSNNLREINASMIDAMPALVSLTLGTNLRTICKYAFTSSPNLYKIIILSNQFPAGIEDAFSSLKYRVTYVSNNLYDGLSVLGTIKLYNLLSSSFFNGNIRYVPVSNSEAICEAIDCDYDPHALSISIPNYIYQDPVTFKVLNYKSHLMQGNSFVQNVTIGEEVYYDGICGFDNCTSLRSINLPETHTVLTTRTFHNCASLRTITLPETLVEIQDGVFSSAKVLESISIPKATVKIWHNSFMNCKSLETLVFQDGQSTLTLGYNSSYQGLFHDCPLVNVTIGRNLSYSTTAVSGYSPFYDSMTLNRVTITNTPTSVPENLCWLCSALENLWIGDRVTTIGENAFSGCSSLEECTIGARVSRIDAEAFSDCNLMESFYVKALTPPVCGQQALDDINKFLCILYIPNGSRSAYKVADQWKEFVTVKEQNFGKPVGTLGDINGDDAVDASDLAALINLITGISSASDDADLTGDGHVDASDLAALINMITGL